MKTEKWPVYYGWNKITGVRKKEAISVIYVNGYPGRRKAEKKNNGVGQWIEVCAERDQTPGEMEDGKGAIKVFSEYSIFMDDPKIRGSLERALFYNSEADKNNVSATERKRIADALRETYLKNHPGYVEPNTAFQLEINFQ